MAVAVAPSKAASYSYTHLLLLRQPRRGNQNYVVFPRRCPLPFTLGLLLVFFLTVTILCLFWPSDPGLKIVRLRLKGIRVHPLPRITIDISMLMRVRVHNADAYTMYLRAVEVAVGYRGRRLGHVRSEYGHVKARGSSYVDAEVEFAGIHVLPELLFFLEDLAKGTVPFDTVTQVRGQLGLLFFRLPIKTKLSCEVLVSTRNQTIVRQHCLHK